MNRSVFFQLLAFLLTVFFIRYLSKPARHIGLVDVPGGRKRHEGDVPLTGGVAMVSAFSLTAMGMGIIDFSHYSFIAGMWLLVVVGVLDDLHDITARTKFIAQIIAAVFMVSWGGLYVSQLGDLLGFGVVHLHGWSIPFTVVCVLGVVNAVNMTDGMDGLAGGIGFIALLWFGVAAAMLKLDTQTSLSLLLLSALAGFLLFNIRHPWRTQASVFMGDAGSMMAGLVLAWFAVDLTQGEGHSLPPITAVWILALPLLDMGGVMVRRIAKGQSPFAADRKHLHHILLLAGYSGTRVVTILLVLSALMGGVGIAAWQLGVPDYAMFYAFLMLLAVYYYLMTRAWSLMKRLKKFHNS